MRTQDLIFTLYGDYIYVHGNRIRISSLIQLLAQFGVSAEATRTTVSRMVRRGWLASEREGKTSYYTFTPRARQLIEEGAARILSAPVHPERWNRCWHLVTFSIPEAQRGARDQFRRELSWLGYGLFTNAVWLSPRNQHAAVAKIAARLQIERQVQSFSAESEGPLSCAALVDQCWNLVDLDAEYAEFIERYGPPYQECRARATALDGRECFTRRLILIHDYRRFPYRDPYLPVELAPKNWHGMEAAQLFQEYHALLAEGANRYFESVYQDHQIRNGLLPEEKR
jgi:phenylacetic acid degradation operon negative regulatory protein